MKLSEMLQSMHDSGDVGRCVEGLIPLALALEAELEQYQWQPIETVDKNRIVLAFDPCLKYPVIAVWSGNVEKGKVVALHSELHDEEFKHWMCIPTLPKKDASE
jgi:hypothetical protein